MLERWIASFVSASLSIACGAAPSADPDAATPSPDATAAPSIDGAFASRCTETATEVSCTYETATFQALAVQRALRYQTPLGTPPPDGWPVVFYFQGSLVSAENAFHATRDAPLGQFQLTRTIKSLLDRGYAVIAPDALVDLAWQTNVPPFSVTWSTTSDHAFLLSIFAGIGDGMPGPIDSTRMYAMGISSGGYMTSRMAVSYPGRFRALVVHSASYATCGLTCIIPAVLPIDHPPTLFVHGANDSIVPIAQMKLYRDALAQHGHVVATLVDEAAGHEWIASSIPAIDTWFDTH
jgi:poly(3-hydroxybutyrate) depolymerase